MSKRNAEIVATDPMAVRRVETGQGSRIEPPLDQSWSEHEKLRWHAGVVLAASGVRVRVAAHEHRSTYMLGGSGWGLGDMPFRQAWDYLNGIEIGAREARKSPATHDDEASR